MGLCHHQHGNCITLKPTAENCVVRAGTEKKWQLFESLSHFKVDVLSNEFSLRISVDFIQQQVKIED